MANKDSIKGEIIKLPYKFDNPDWDYMDKYIKSLSVNSIMQ